MNTYLLQVLFPRRSPRWGGVTRVLTAVLMLSVSSVSSAVFLTATGGTKSTFKSIATGTDLSCDLVGVPIDATGSLLSLTPPTLIIGGPTGTKVRCEEVSRTNDPANPPKQGLFTLQQTALDNCLTMNGADGDRIWTCLVNRNTTARWRLTPDDANTFCVVPGSNPVAYFAACYAEHGTPDRPKVTDFPDRDVNNDAVNDFGKDGVVFTFSERGGKLLFGPCHSGTFEGGQPVSCEKKLQGVSYKTQSTGTADADFPTVIANIVPDSLNLNNSSDTSTFPVVFYGAPPAVIASLIGTTNITLVGSGGVLPPLAVKSTSLVYASGPTGGTGDGVQDLKVEFERATLIQAITAPPPSRLGLCPNPQTTVTLRFRGPYLKPPASAAILSGNNWTALAQVDIFNCPN
jgi:hypothetical protein